jgi:lysophospholipase L1-like esterase
MKHGILICVCIWIGVSVSVPAAHPFHYNDPEGYPADGIKRRNGLPNVTKKLTEGRPVTVAYLGGSITYADGWRVHADRLLREKFPASEIKMVNAGVPGTSSALGAARLERDVLRHNPDLVFVEFAVNGGGIGTGAGDTWCDYSRSAMEAIVRQIAVNNPQTDICFVYTCSTYLRKWFDQKELPPVVIEQEAVADFYGIPSVIMAADLLKQIRDGSLVWEENTPLTAGSDGLERNSRGQIVFTKDGTHPVDSNAVLYAKKVMEAFEKMPWQQELNHECPDNLLVEKNRWLNASMADLSVTDMQGFVKIDKPVSGIGGNIPGDYNGTGTAFFNTITHFPHVYKGSAGSRITVRFDGSNIGFYGLTGKFSGKVRVSIDGQDFGPVYLLAKQNTGFTKHSFFFLPDTLPPGPHTATFTVEAMTLDEKFEFSGRKIDRNDPDYLSNEVYFGTILVCGKIK